MHGKCLHRQSDGTRLGGRKKKYTQTDEKKEKEIKKLNQNQKSFRDLILQFKCT